MLKKYSFLGIGPNPLKTTDIPGFLKISLSIVDANENIDLDQSDCLNINEKIDLANAVQELDDQTLRELVDCILKNCPKVVEDINDMKLQIRVDLIDRSTYDRMKV